MLEPFFKSVVPFPVKLHEMARRDEDAGGGRGVLSCFQGIRGRSGAVDTESEELHEEEDVLLGEEGARREDPARRQLRRPDFAQDQLREGEETRLPDLQAEPFLSARECEVRGRPRLLQDTE